jgi:hypothetical protein
LARGLEDGHSTGCPVSDAQAAYGFECGQKEAGELVHARLSIELAEMEQRQTELDALEMASNYGGY